MRFANLEPSSIYDDRGLEMWLADLIVSNTATGPPTDKNYVYVEDSSQGIQAKSDGMWTPVQGKVGFHGLAPGRSFRALLLLPRDMDSCRVYLRCTGVHLFKGRIAWLAEHLPQTIRFRLGTKFWNWVGFPGYRPSSNWREITLEIEMPKLTTAPLPGQASTHELDRANRLSSGTPADP